MLYQTAEIPTIDIDFSVSAKLYAWDNHASAWAGAAVVVWYLDASNVALGNTRICYRSSGCPWNNSSTCHVIPVYDSLWHDYSFNLEDELANIPEVLPGDVKKIKVVLVDSVIHC